MMLFIFKLKCFIRGALLSILYQKKIRRAGSGLKFFGSKYFSFDGDLAVGDNCWLDAVSFYKGNMYNPFVKIGANVSLGDNVHISCVNKITIGDNCLIGSKVYIGDHSHGSTNINLNDFEIPPAMRPLSDIDEIYIGKNVWIGDGAVILAGAYIADGCIVGANSVVKNKFYNLAIIAGVPAKEKKI